MQGIFLDIDGAFEKVWHLGLLAKLERANVSGKCLDLFRSYLPNREQVTVVDGCKSEVRTLTAGIPQGSKLGPILFILYTNDIQKDIESEILLYSDDMSLLASGRNTIETSEKLNRDLARISTWAEMWKVKFNADKSCDILFSTKSPPTNPLICSNGETIKKVTEHKHL